MNQKTYAKFWNFFELMDENDYIPQATIVESLRRTINAIADIDNPSSLVYIADLLHYVICTKRYTDLSFYFKNPGSDLIEADKGVEIVFRTLKTFMNKSGLTISLMRSAGILPIQMETLSKFVA